ncbi:hypothetical protein ACSSS7_007585 [Eimeria intestinalis]
MCRCEARLELLHSDVEGIRWAIEGLEHQFDSLKEEAKVGVVARDSIKAREGVEDTAALLRKVGGERRGGVWRGQKYNEGGGRQKGRGPGKRRRAPRSGRVMGTAGGWRVAKVAPYPVRGVYGPRVEALAERRAARRVVSVRPPSDVLQDPVGVEEERTKANKKGVRGAT